eukprot:4013713-Prymnesium_polylepis.3
MSRRRDRTTTRVQCPDNVNDASYSRYTPVHQLDSSLLLLLTRHGPHTNFYFVLVNWSLVVLQELRRGAGGVVRVLHRAPHYQMEHHRGPIARAGGGGGRGAARGGRRALRVPQRPGCVAREGQSRHESERST